MSSKQEVEGSTGATGRRKKRRGQEQRLGVSNKGQVAVASRRERVRHPQQDK